MMSERVEKRSNSASPLNKLGKSIAFGCALGVLVSLLKHQRDEGHLKRSRVEHERAMMSFNSGSNGKSNSNNVSVAKKPETPIISKNVVSPPKKQTKSKKDKIIQNFHSAINSTKSDQIIVKMLELNENDIVNFYSNLEKMIGKDLSLQIRENMSHDITQNQKSSGNKNFAMCPFCHENKSNCVILLCGHLICHKCGKNINRCKYPCPKCKKPIKYIQYIVD